MVEMIVNCPECGDLTKPYWKWHYCLRKIKPGEKSVSTDYQLKKWNHNLQCWVLDNGPKVNDGRFWDAKTGTWVLDPAHADKPSEIPLTKAIAAIGKEKAEEIPNGSQSKKTVYESSSCELGPRKSVAEVPKWAAARPWVGVDKNRFPSTFMKLVQMYYATDWYQAGPYIADEVYLDRVQRGIYKPEPKKVDKELENSYRPYMYGQDWE